MNRIVTLVGIVSLLSCAWVNGQTTTPAPLISGTFPKGFIWSAATSAYQIEGGWNADGKGQSIWDFATHQKKSPVKGGTNGNVACDSYHDYLKDVMLLKNVGITHYVFSLSWSRIFPNGMRGSMNPAGVQYYKNLIGNLTANGVQPIVKLYHGDLPLALQQNQRYGWLNASSPSWFADYADFCFSTFGSMVKYWVTFNTPFESAWLSYGAGAWAPQISNCNSTCPYIVGHNILKAHAMAWHRYNSTYRMSQKGQVGITLNSEWKEPGSTNPYDVAAAERALEFKIGWFANPLFHGDYPAVMKSYVNERSLAQGLTQTRLTPLTSSEILKIKGAVDFIGFNSFTSQLVYNQPITSKNQLMNSDYMSDQQLMTMQPASWKGTSEPWLKFAPWGLRKVLNWIKNKYNNPQVIITETGWSDSTGTLQDSDRAMYYQYYINAALQAIKDGCNLKGYGIWSLMDNFEWMDGYTQKFGMHFVNFSNPARPRIQKNSAKMYSSIIKNNGFPGGSVPVSTTTAYSGAMNLLHSCPVILCLVVAALFLSSYGLYDF